MERCFPQHIVTLPTIVLPNNTNIEGLPKIILFYEQQLNITNLLENSKKFNDLNPNYKITDKSTHRTIINF